MKAKVVAVTLTLLGGLLPGALASPSGDSTDPRTRRSPDDLSRAFQSGAIDRAEYALERAASLFDLSQARRRFGEVRRQDPHAATLLLRDLATEVEDLEGSDKKRAQRILARPTDGAADPQEHGYEPGATFAYDCREVAPPNPSKVCVHWVTDTEDAPAAGIVEQTFTALQTVWDKEIEDLGFRKPLRDGGPAAEEGPNTALDFYIADIGADGIYGYCANDDPVKGTRRQSAYCVLDNDFSSEDFEPGISGEGALKVTVAHEFFHAVQFAYDFKERRFFMEGTAVWVEDEVYDDINANYEYLHDSALHQPEVPLDAGDVRSGENFEYGSWLFWRFLSESQSDAFIKALWESAAGTPGVVAALKSRLRAKGTSLSNAYALFALWNRTIDAGNNGLVKYEEGFAYMAAVNYRYPPWDAYFWIGSPDRPKTGARSLRLDHLSMRYVMVEARASTPSGAKLRYKVDLPSGVHRARVIVVGTRNFDPNTGWSGDFCTKWYSIRTDARGRGSAAVPFKRMSCGGSTAHVWWTTLVLVNGSSSKRSDNKRFDYKATVIS